MLDKMYTYLSIGTSSVLAATAFAYGWYTSHLVRPPMPPRIPKDSDEKETWYMHITNSKLEYVKNKLDNAGLTFDKINIGKVVFYIVVADYDSILPFYDVDGVRSIGRNQGISVA